MRYPVIQKEGAAGKKLYTLNTVDSATVFKGHNGQAWDRTKGRCHTVTVMLPLHHLAGSGE
jgi:hypothetical protein